MNTATLLRRNLAHFWRTNLAVVLGVSAATAVLAGALLVGDSVRASLRDIFLRRSGRASHVVASAGFFRERLGDEVEADPRFASAGLADVCPLVVLQGTVTHESSGRRADGVQVYGVDERFWKFHGVEGGDGIAPRGREVLASAGLAEELKLAAGDTLLLRVEKYSGIPAESLHGRKEDLGRTVRATAKGALDASRMGEFTARPQQGTVRAVFVPLALVQRELELEGRVNTLLVSSRSEAGGETGALERILRERAAPEDLGVRLRALPAQGSVSLETESAIVSDALAEAARAASRDEGARALSVLSYLANGIRVNGREVPYSLVTALDEGGFEELRRASAATTEGTVVASPSVATVADGADGVAPILLNEWAAEDLGARAGDEVTLEYYVWKDDNRLATESAKFRLAGVLPIAGLAADRDLVPAYPGITETESLADWDPPFPIDLKRVRPKDEDYWKKYRTTPKAFAPLARAQELWGTRFGRLTSVRLYPQGGAPTGGDARLQTFIASYGARLKESLDPTRSGLNVYAARAEGLAAAKGATDFGEYFLYFSFFIVASALMLTVLFFKLGVEQRLREIGTLRAVGFPESRVRAIFVAEGFALALAGSLLGLVGATLYGRLMMHGLRTWWVGATGTTELALHVSPATLAAGAGGAVVVSLLCVVWTLRRLRPAPVRSLLAGTWEGARAKTRGGAEGDGGGVRGLRASAGRFFSRLNSSYLSALVFGVPGLLLLAAAWGALVGQVAGFFGGGTLLLVALLLLQSAWLRRGERAAITGRGLWPVARLGLRGASQRPARSVLCITLVASAAFIVVAVDAFRRGGAGEASDAKSGTGGYALMAESVLPVIQDPNTPEGRDALNLAGDARATVALEGTRVERFRLRPGDDASCLNLYRPREPRVVAPTDDFLRQNRFTFQGSLARAREAKENPWLLLNEETSNGAVPVVADSNSLAYVLHLNLGDEFTLGGDAGPRLRVVGALSDSVFQGELLMSEKNFVRLFPEQEGYRFFLVEAPTERADAASAALEARLGDYGFDAQPTAERLAAFHRVENTYLSTFQLLGGLGLVLGTLGLSAVLLRNVLERRRELAMLRAVGYSRTHLAQMVLAENALLLFCGLLTGTLCALLAVAPVALARGGRLPVFSLGLLVAAVVAAGMIASLVATAAALRAPLVQTLRAE